jgi:hypothetical protein
METKQKARYAGVIKAAIWLCTVLVIAGTVIFVVNAMTKKTEPEITNTFISNKIETAGELTSAKMTYNGLIRYSDGDIPFLTKKGFSMIYRAEVRAGIDLSKVKVDVTDTEVQISIPEIEILNISIDTDSIEYYDQQWALFNGESKQDALQAISAAKDDVTANGDVDALKATAKEQTETLLNSLFYDSIGDRTLKIVFA